jgi:CheY-like chemotaxis protein
MDFDAQPILLAEDNEDDVFIFRRAVAKAGLKHPLHVVNDGQELTDYLSGAGEFTDRQRHPLPFLLMLDLKLPLCNGLEVLEWIRREPKLEKLIVVVLTSSAEARDLKCARELGARHYLVKPPAAKTLFDLMAILRAEAAAKGARPRPRLDGDLLVEPEGLSREQRIAGK